MTYMEEEMPCKPKKFWEHTEILSLLKYRWEYKVGHRLSWECIGQPWLRMHSNYEKQKEGWTRSGKTCYSVKSQLQNRYWMAFWVNRPGLGVALSRSHQAFIVSYFKNIFRYLTSRVICLSLPTLIVLLNSLSLSLSTLFFVCEDWT